MIAPQAFLLAFDALPLGSFVGKVQGRKYAVSRTDHASGKSRKLVAHELGGTDFISFNLYTLKSGDVLLRPCEMPAVKVIDFTNSLQVSL